MHDIYITKIQIDKVRHLANIDIELSDKERKHLILTGKNGSGKTSLLQAMQDSVLAKQEDPLQTTKSGSVHISYSKDLKDFTGYWPLQNETFAYIPAERSRFELPKVIEPIAIDRKNHIQRNASKEFLKYILSLDYQLYSAKIENNRTLEDNLDKWFDSFLATLRSIYGCQELTLLRDAKNFAFKIEMPGREPFALHEMSDGYAAFLEIFMELIMRFERDNALVDYNQSAIVMIDEVEAHLHVELQKQILPFLTKMFPNVQFVVSTHSPFVMTSLSNAVVYDLEHLEELVNPGIYSYEAVVEGYLNVGQYSNEVRDSFNRYKELYSKELSDTEAVELKKLISVLQLVPPASKELYFAFRTMEDNRKR